MEGFLRDITLAARSLRRSPGLLSLVTLTLALGIGANTAIFSAAWATLVEPLPYSDPDRLFFLWSDLDQAGYIRAPISGPELFDFREGSLAFEDFASIWTTTGQLSGEGEPEQIKLGLVTANFLKVLGVVPALGRDFRPEEEGSEARVLILSHGLWQRRFGGDPGIVGRSIRADGTSATVVGVLPRGFEPLFARDANVPPDLQALSPFGDRLRTLPRGDYFLRTIGRVRPGVSAHAAREEIDAISRRIVPPHTEYAASGRRFYAVPLKDDVAREIRPALLALLGGVILLLLLACVNVANLLLARSLLRERETALRIALGASRRHLLRQCLAQGLVLAALGGTAGTIVGALGIEALVRLRPEGLVRLDAARLNLPVLLFTVGVSIAAGLLFSLAPLRELHAGRPAGGAGLGRAYPGPSGPAHARRPRRRAGRAGGRPAGGGGPAHEDLPPGGGGASGLPGGERPHLPLVPSASALFRARGDGLRPGAGAPDRGPARGRGGGCGEPRPPGQPAELVEPVPLRDRRGRDRPRGRRPRREPGLLRRGGGGDPRGPPPRGERRRGRAEGGGRGRTARGQGVAGPERHRPGAHGRVPEGRRLRPHSGRPWWAWCATSATAA